MRLFIAVNFSETIRGQIWEAVEPLRAAEYPVRWVDKGLLHLTLKFLGNVDAKQVSEVADVVSRMGLETRPFHMTIAGLGAFPAPRHPHTIWAGCEPVPGLELLQHGVEKACAALGFSIEARTFRPHITLGRVQRDATRRQLQGIDRELARVELVTEAYVSSVDLMESKTHADGPEYRVVRSGEFAQ